MTIDKDKSFEYILYKMINWYIDENKCSTIDDFNSKNSFSKEKVLLFPFFVFAANGNRKKILDSFISFTAEKDGLIVTDFDIQNVNLFKITENKTIIDKAKFKDIVIGSDLLLEDNTYFKLLGESKNIFDDSFATLKKKNETFINLDIETLKFYSQRHNSWQVFYNGKACEIPEIILLNEKSIFSNQPGTFTYV